MFQKHSTIWVCDACIHHHNNGECGACHDEVYGHDKEPLSAVQDGFYVATGLGWDDHADTCDNRIKAEWSVDCDCETDIYSTWQCEGCGSYLHGKRHAMTLFRDNPNG